MITNQNLLSKGIAAALLLAGSTMAFAEPSPTGTLTLNTNGYSDSSGGGEFNVVGSGLSTTGYASTTGPGSFGAGTFETFCMAFNEDFAPGNSFGYFLSNTTYGNGTNPNVPLTQGVAYLYSQFAKGSLQGYDYSNADNSGTGGFKSRADSALALQIAIWWAEGEDTGGVFNEGAPLPTGFSTVDNTYVTLLKGLGTTWSTTAASNDYDGVQILVLTNTDSGHGSTPNSQPQLYYSVPDNGTTALLIGGSLLGLAMFRRRLKAVASR